VSFVVTTTLALGSFMRFSYLLDLNRNFRTAYTSKQQFCFYAATVAVFVTVIFAAPASAQLATSEEKGLPPNGVFSGGDVDAVNIQNGNLHIAIPLETSAQRGGATIKWQLVYDTPAWIKRWVPYNCTHCNPSGYYYIEQNSNVVSGWRLTSSLDYSVGFTDSGVINCQTSNVGYQQETNWVVYDPQGTQHPLPLRGEIGPYSCLGKTLRGPTLDGSGMVYDAQTYTLYLKDGTQINVNNSYQFTPTQTDNLPFLVRDKNGNTITPNSDTLGRSFLATTNGPTGGFTTPLGNTISGIQYVTYTTRDSNGNPSVFRVDYQAIDVLSDICANTPALGVANCTDGGSPQIVPSKLTLPNGKAYVFTYNNNTPGELSRLDLPTGGSIAYTYGDLYQMKANPQQGSHANYVGSPAVISRAVTVGGQTNTWSYGVGPFSGSVRDPMGNTELHTFSPVYVNNGPIQLATDGLYDMSVAYSDLHGTTLKTVNNTYTGEIDPANNIVANVRVIQTATTLDNGLTSQQQTDYETFQYSCVNAGGACTGTATRLNPTEIREYSFGAGSAGSLMRRTAYSYLHSNNQSYIDLNIVNKPSTVTVYDGIGNMAAQAVNEYDNYSHPNQPFVASNAIQHDSG
jgi:hypothetical protein